MKKHLFLLLAALFPMLANAYDAKINGIYYNFSGDEAEVTYRDENFNSYSGNVTIPKSVTYNDKTYSVTSIGANAFNSCSGLTRVIIPNGVTSIGGYAFFYCTSLTSITIPNSVTSIGDEAFYGTAWYNNQPDGLIYAGKVAYKYKGDMPNGTQIKLKTGTLGIAEFAFSGCSGLTSVTIPNSVTSIGNYAFYQCSGLTSITISNSVTSIGEAAFYRCSGLTSVTIPNSVTSIGNYAFYDCSRLTSITIPNSVTTIGGSAFENCTSLTSITIGNSVTSIGYGAFSGCSSLTSITFHCKEIGSWFNSMSSIMEVIIGDGVTSIGGSAFWGCSGLTSITIPGSVTSIGDYAFYYCSSLTSITIPESVTKIGDGAFCECSGLTSVTIPESVTSIGDFAFSSCCSLTSITIPESVTSIGNYAFSGCSGLTSVTIPGSVTTIGGYAFRGCSSLTSVIVGRATPVEIGYETFTNRSNATLYVLTGYESKYKNADYWKEFKEIVGIPQVDGILYLPDKSNKVAEVLPLLTQGKYSGDVVIPSSITYNEETYRVTSICNYAFYGCSGVTSITIPESVTSIGSRAFTGCSSLGTIVVEQGNPTFDSRNNCNAIIETSSNKLIVGCKNTTIPNNVTCIGSYAFDSCSGLISLTISVGVLSIEDNAFYNTSPKKVIWLTNTPPEGYTNVNGAVNYVANDRYPGLTNVVVYQFLSSMFEVDGVKYVPVSPSERTCDAIDCAYNASAENISIGNTVTNRGVSLTVKQRNPYLCYGNPYIKEAHVSFTGVLPDYAFSSCPVLQTADLGEEITSIGSDAFSGCAMLEGIVIPASVTSIGNNAFEGCSSFTTIQIPQSVTTIADNVFGGCTSLKTFLMDNGEAKLNLGSNDSNPLFADCPLDSVYIGRNIVYPTVSNKGYSPFYRNMTLRTVTITDEETEISKNEFYGCANLKDIKIGDGVTTFGDYAFSGCSSLEAFAFGSNVKTIGKEAFSDCSAIKQLVSKASTPPTCGSQALDDINKWTCKLWVPEDGNTAYQQAKQWKEFFFIEEGTGDDSPVEDINIVFADTNVKDICVANWDANGDGELSKEEAAAATDLGVVFKGNTNINSFNELNYFTGLTSITSSFSGCNGLTSITIPKSVTSINNSAFSGCSNLTSVTLESDAIVSATRTSSTSMKAIFGNQVREYIIGNDVKGIGSYAFYACANLVSVTIGSGVLSIGNEAFSNTSPKKIVWLTNTPPEGYEAANGTVNYVANDQYASLKDVTVYPFLSSLFEVDGVKYVPISPSERTCDAIDCAYNESAENINIGNTVTNSDVSLDVKQLKPYLCYGNPLVKAVQMSFNGMLPDYAFYGCSALQTADLGEDVTSIGSNAFKSCSTLDDIVISGSVTSIGNNAFEDCSSLPLIQIPQKVTTIADYVFGGCTSLKTVLMDDGETELSLGSNGSNPLFADCPLDSVYIGRNITYSSDSEKGYSPFYRNTTLRSVAITDEETEISKNEFYGCTNLKDVKIGDGVTTIGDNAFSGCVSLEAFSFGFSVETIGKEAFSDCIAMATLVSKAETPPVCGAQALDDINKWECTLLVPVGFVEAYQEAPQWREFFFVDIDPDGIREIESLTPALSEDDGEWYSLDGKKLSMPQKGINIIRYSDGTSKKVVIK